MPTTTADLMKLHDAAARIGYAHDTVRKWKTNKRHPDLPLRMVLGRWYAVQPDFDEWARGKGLPIFESP